MSTENTKIEYYLPKAKSLNVLQKNGFIGQNSSFPGELGAIITVFDIEEIKNGEVFKCQAEGALQSCINTTLMLLSNLDHSGLIETQREWKYIDFSGMWQGPFSLLELHAWKHVPEFQSIMILNETTEMWMSFAHLMEVYQHIKTYNEQGEFEVSNGTNQNNQNQQNVASSGVHSSPSDMNPPVSSDGLSQEMIPEDLLQAPLQTSSFTKPSTSAAGTSQDTQSNQFTVDLLQDAILRVEMLDLQPTDNKIQIPIPVENTSQIQKDLAELEIPTPVVDLPKPAVTAPMKSAEVPRQPQSSVCSQIQISQLSKAKQATSSTSQFGSRPYSDSYSNQSTTFSHTKERGQYGRAGPGNGVRSTGYRPMNPRPIDTWRTMNQPIYQSNYRGGGQRGRMMRGSARGRFYAGGPDNAVKFSPEVDGLLMKLGTLPVTIGEEASWKAIVDQVSTLLEESFSTVLIYVFQAKFGVLWKDVMCTPTPWTAQQTLEISERHWNAVFREFFSATVRRLLEEVTRLYKLIHKDGPNGELVLKMCSLLSDLIKLVRLQPVTDGALERFTLKEDDIESVSFAKALDEMNKARLSMPRILGNCIQEVRIVTGETVRRRTVAEAAGTVNIPLPQPLYERSYAPSRPPSTFLPNTLSPSPPPVASTFLPPSLSPSPPPAPSTHVPPTSSTTATLAVVDSAPLPVPVVENPGGGRGYSARRSGSLLMDVNPASSNMMDVPGISAAQNSSETVLAFQKDVKWARDATRSYTAKPSSGYELLKFVKTLIHALAVYTKQHSEEITQDQKKLLGLQSILERISTILLSLKALRSKEKTERVAPEVVMEVLTAMKDFISLVYIEAYKYCKRLQMPDNRFITEFQDQLTKSNGENLNVIINFFEESYSQLKSYT